MTQEEKQLLLKDILPRQLYGVKVHYRYHDFVGGSERLIHEGDGVIKGINLTLGNPILIDGFHIEVEDVKPYLRPMSSMTDDEINELDEVCDGIFNINDTNIEVLSMLGWVDSFENILKGIDWLNKKMFDYRGLIPMGLALEAPEDMYKF